VVIDDDDDDGYVNNDEMNGELVVLYKLSLLFYKTYKLELFMFGAGNKL
jgi:hypothetical protein